MRPAAAGSGGGEGLLRGFGALFVDTRFRTKLALLVAVGVLGMGRLAAAAVRSGIEQRRSALAVKLVQQAPGRARGEEVV